MKFSTIRIYNKFKIFQGPAFDFSKFYNYASRSENSMNDKLFPETIPFTYILYVLKNGSVLLELKNQSNMVRIAFN